MAVSHKPNVPDLVLEAVMKLKARLYPVDGAVLCPRSLEWTDPEHCYECEFVQADETPRDGRFVVCRPEVQSYFSALEGIIHA